MANQAIYLKHTHNLCRNTTRMSAFTKPLCPPTLAIGHTYQSTFIDFILLRGDLPAPCLSFFSEMIDMFLLSGVPTQHHLGTQQMELTKLEELTERIEIIRREKLTQL